MGYSNVAGDLNVYGISSLSDLIVRGGVTNYGSLVNYGLTTLGTATIANLSVTGNLIITATNTQTTNSLTINNAGTATALKVIQYEGGGGGHTHNVAEFWDFQTLAMIIDPEGNVGIHTTASPGYAFTALGGALMDDLTLNTPLSISSGGIGAATATTNYVFAGPSIGAPGTPSFRALVSADLPSSIIVSNIAGNGAALYSLTGSNVTGNVARSDLALVVSQASQPNITSVGVLSSLVVGGILNSNLFTGNASGLANITGSNVTGNVARSDLALVVSQASQPNITSVGVLSSLVVGGILNSNLFTGNASGLANITGSNVTGNVARSDLALVVSQASQPNITSVGLLSNLAVANSVTCTNVFTSNIVFTNPSSGIYSMTRSADLIDGNGNFVLNGLFGLVSPYYRAIPIIDSTGSIKLVTTAGSQGILSQTGQSILSPGGVLTLYSGSSSVNSYSNDPIIDENGTVYLLAYSSGIYSSGSQQIVAPSGLVNLLSGLQISGAPGTTGQVLSATGVGNGIQWSSNIFSANAITTTNLFANTLTLANATSTINVIGSVTATTFYGVHAGANTGAFSNIFAANALTTTNIFVTGNVTVGDLLSVGGVPGLTSLNVTGNIYASNALTTTNIFSAGFTSDASNTNFFYSTLTVPFIYSTTLNVASTANVLTASIQGSTGATSLAVTGNVVASNALTTTNVYLISGVTNSTGGQIVKGALEFNGTSNVFYGTSSTIRGLIPVQYFYQLNADTALGTTASVTLVPAFPGMVNGVQLQNGKYYVKMIHVLTITTSATAGNTQLNMVFASATGTATASMATGGVWSQNVTATSGPGSTASAQTVNTIFFNSSSAAERISAITTAVSTSTTYYTTIEGTFAIIAPGGWYPIAQMTSPGTFTATPGVRRGSFIYLQKIGDNAADVNIGGWS